jgi:ATP-dependent metalloprotease
MSEKLGNVDLDSNHSKLSSETKQVIESEVRRTIEEGRVRATQLLISKKKELDLLARALVDYETLNKEEAYKVIKGEKLAGRIAVPPRDMKLPEGPGPSNLGGINGIPGISPIPGSGEQNPPPASPPQGGLAA